MGCTIDEIINDTRPNAKVLLRLKSVAVPTHEPVLTLRIGDDLSVEVTKSAPRPMLLPVWVFALILLVPPWM